MPRRTLLSIGVFLLAAVAFPLGFPDSYSLGVATFTGAMAIGSIGLVLLLGYAHQLALGQAAFCMIGGYTSAILTTRAWDPLAALVVGAVVSMLLALCIAVPILRLRGFVLAMASLSLHLILVVVATQSTVTGGALGIFGVPKFSALGLPLGSDRVFYALVWASVLGAVVVGLNIDRSRVGRALKALGSSEVAAQSLGIEVARYKVQMFVVSAGMASIAGSLGTHYLRAIDPSVYGFNFSLNLLTAVIIGGLTSVWGGVLGAGAVAVTRELLRFAGVPLWDAVIMGSLTVTVLLFFPGGLAALLEALFIRSRSARATGAMHGDASTAAARGRLERVTEAWRGDLPLLFIDDVSRRFGNLVAVNGISFSAAARSITSVIGPNGAGKTTMFNMICGSERLSSGKILFLGQEIQDAPAHEIALRGLARTFQAVELFETLSVVENVMCGCHGLMKTGLLSASMRFPAVAREEAEAYHRAMAMLRLVGLEHLAAGRPAELSFGQQRLVELARALALDPVLLMMDEPASGLNDTETEQLAGLLATLCRSGITILLVEHDMRLVMGLSDEVVVVHHGEMIASGSPEEVRRNALVISAYLGRETHEPAARVD